MFKSFWNWIKRFFIRDFREEVANEYRPSGPKPTPRVPRYKPLQMERRNMYKSVEFDRRRETEREAEIRRRDEQSDYTLPIIAAAMILSSRDSQSTPVHSEPIRNDPEPSYSPPAEYGGTSDFGYTPSDSGGSSFSDSSF